MINFVTQPTFSSLQFFFFVRNYFMNEWIITKCKKKWRNCEIWIRMHFKCSTNLNKFIIFDIPLFTSLINLNFKKLILEIEKFQSNVNNLSFRRIQFQFSNSNIKHIFVNDLTMFYSVLLHNYKYVVSLFFLLFESINDV